MEDLVVIEVAGLVEEEVVLDSVEGNDRHGDLDETAFVGGGDDVKGGYAQAEGGSGDGVCGYMEPGLGWGGGGIEMARSGSCFARWPTHAMRLHEWGTRICAGNKDSDEGEES